MTEDFPKATIDNVKTACRLLVDLGLVIVQSLNQVDPKSRRIRMFQLSILRAIRIAEGALVLDERNLIEEVLSLTRMTQNQKTKPLGS